jgi:hypothetical protein
MNVSAVAVQVFIGGEFETQSVANMTRLVDEGNRYGIPVLAVTAVGKELVRDAKYLRLACRICAELGAAFVKTYYVPEDFETVTASCPVPIVIAGGKKLPELEALRMAHASISQGAAGVDMGRNIFQADSQAPSKPSSSTSRPSSNSASASRRCKTAGRKPKPLGWAALMTARRGWRNWCTPRACWAPNPTWPCTAAAIPRASARWSMQSAKHGPRSL